MGADKTMQQQLLRYQALMRLVSERHVVLDQIVDSDTEEDAAALVATSLAVDVETARLVLAAPLGRFTKIHTRAVAAEATRLREEIDAAGEGPTSTTQTNLDGLSTEESEELLEGLRSELRTLEALVRAAGEWNTVARCLVESGTRGEAVSRLAQAWSIDNECAGAVLRTSLWEFSGPAVELHRRRITELNNQLR